MSSLITVDVSVRAILRVLWWRRNSAASLAFSSFPVSKLHTAGYFSERLDWSAGWNGGKLVTPFSERLTHWHLPFEIVQKKESDLYLLDVRPHKLRRNIIMVICGSQGHRMWKRRFRSELRGMRKRPQTAENLLSEREGERRERSPADSPSGSKRDCN